jgi:hypothetical protein
MPTPGPGLTREAGPRLRVERENIVWLDQQRYRLPRGRWFPSLGARHYLTPALGQAHMQESVGAELFDQDQLAGQLRGTVQPTGGVRQVQVLRPHPYHEAVAVMTTERTSAPRKFGLVKTVV